MGGTSTEDVFGNPVEEETEKTEETKTEETEETEEPVEEDTSEKTELDLAKETLAETQALLKRYKEQVSGSQEEAEKFKIKIKELEARIPPEEKEALSELTPQDQQTKAYLKKLGIFTKDEVERIVQEKVAPFQAERTARERSEQKRVLGEFIKSKSALGENKDPEGVKMQQILAKLKRIAPADPLDPNASLKEDLELAYKWAFGEEIQKEVLSKAEAKGRAEGHEAGEAKVGEGTSSQTSTSKRQRTPEQEAVLKEWGVDDETYLKK